MADTPVHEDVSNKSFRDGKPDANSTKPHDDSTNKQGVIGDESTISVSTSAPSLPGTNAAKQTLENGDFSKQTTQTLTTTSPTGSSCSVTEQRTLSIKDGEPSMTLQSLQTQKATATPTQKPTPTPAKKPDNQ